MENESLGFVKLMKDFTKAIYPDAATFVTFVTPFFTQYKNEYEKYIKILDKIGVKNGIQGVAEMLCGMPEASIGKSDALFKKMLEEMEKRYGDGKTPPTMEQFFKGIEHIFTIEWTMANGHEMYEAANSYSEQNKLSALDEEAEKLPEDERAIYDSYSSLLLKLWLYKIVTSPMPEEVMKLILKDALPRYYKGVNALYGREAVPKELIEYIENIKIPGEEKWRNVIAGVKQEEYTPQTTIPVFQHIQEILNVLKHYFDTPQHEALSGLLRTGISNEKLVFKGKGNQLADAFKKLFTANLIIGCNKEELITWICSNFNYKNRERKYVSFDEKYLSNIISTEQKTCMNPIIDIKKDESGKITILSPDRTIRKNNKI